AVITRFSIQLDGNEAIRVANLKAERWKLAQPGSYQDLPGTQTIQGRGILREPLAIRHNHDFRAAAGVPTIKCAEHGQCSICTAGIFPCGAFIRDVAGARAIFDESRW